MKKKSEFIEFLKQNHSDMKVHFVDKTANPIGCWKAEKTISELNLEELNQVNLRKQLDTEVILDLEEKFRLDDIVKKLKEKNYSYVLWDTGSRGYHISIIFTNLKDLDNKIKDKIRDYIIGEFGTDKRMSSHNQWIALEHSKHFKTGREKIMVEDYSSDVPNTLPESVIDYCTNLVKDKNFIQIHQPDEEFKNFLDDPYLKYAISNVMTSGNRNNVLFKNLAIGLVKSGISGDEIVKLAEAIVENCPGKNIGEFMGWVNKAMNKELDYYNKAEMVNWGLSCDIEPQYILIEEFDETEIMRCNSLWNILWNANISCQPVWQKMCFFNLISTLIQEREKDFRIHVAFSCNSTSGKDEGLNLIKDMLDKLGYDTDKPTTITDRTLLGAKNQMKDEYNVKWGLDEDNQVSTDGKKNYKEPKEKGLLSTCDWLGFGESQTVLSPGAYNQDMQVIFRQVMDKTGYVSKGVGGVMIKFYSHTSLAFTTFPLDTIIHKLFDNGFFQRLLYLSKTISDEEHKIIRKHIAQKRDKTIQKNYIDLLLKKLKEIKLWYNGNRNNISETDYSDYIDGLWDKYEKSFNIFTGSDKSNIMSMTRRLTLIVNKLYKLNAISDMRTETTKEDVDCAFKLVTNCLDSVRDMMLKSGKSKGGLISLLMILKDASNSSGNIHKLLETTANLKSPNTRNKIIRQAETAGFVTNYKDGYYTMYSITEKGREEIGEEI